MHVSACECVCVVGRDGDTRETEKGGSWELWVGGKSRSFLIEPSGPVGSIGRGQAWSPGKPELNYFCLTKKSAKEKML